MQKVARIDRFYMDHIARFLEPHEKRGRKLDPAKFDDRLQLGQF
jgi:hypothetical protein